MEVKSGDIKDSIEAFYAKCAKLNVPHTVMPEPQFLKRIFRGYMSPFESFNNRVDTKQAIKHIRDVILIHKMKDIKKSSIKNSNPNSLPEELRLYLNYQQCCERIKACQVNSAKSKQQEVLERVKKNDVQKKVAQKELDLKKSRLDVLKALSNKLNDDIKKEEEVAEKIESNQQVLKSQNVLDEATTRITKTLEVFKDFNAKGISSSVAKENCWKEIKKNMYNIPNALLYEILNNLLKSKAEDPLFNDDESSAQNISIQQEMLDKFRELKIKLGFQLIASKRDVDDIKQTCAAKIQQVENQLEMHLDNSTMFYDDDDDDIVGEFVSALIAKLIQEGKMKFIQDKMQPLKENSEMSSKFFENLMQNIQDSSQLIKDKVNGIQVSIAEAHVINEKGKFANMKLMRTVNNLKLEKYQQTNRTMLNQTIAGYAEKSIESGVLRSELDLFLVVPLKGEEKINLNMEQLLASSPITQLFTHNLPSFIKSLKVINDLIQSAQKCAIEVHPTHGTALNSQFLESLEKSRDINRAEIKEIFDNITRMNVNIKGLFGNIQSIYKYIQDSPLKKFIDPKQKYENKTYLEYEKEYMLYYKMIKQ